MICDVLGGTLNLTAFYHYYYYYYYYSLKTRKADIGDTLLLSDC